MSSPSDDPSATQMIAFPEPDRDRMTFEQWAAYYFRDDLRDVLRKDFRHAGYGHQRVNDAWEAWKISVEYQAAENKRLRKLLAEFDRLVIKTPIMFEK